MEDHRSVASLIEVEATALKYNPFIKEHNRINEQKLKSTSKYKRIVKKLNLFGLFFLFVTGFSFVNGQTIRNLRFTQEGKQITIYYDLISSERGQTYDVKVFLSTDGGKGMKGPLEKLSGDHGQGIRPGTGKMITWDVLAEMEKLTGEVLFELSVMQDGFTDIDGNTYRTVKLGNQVWMAENLKVKNYPDGSSIPLVKDNAAWAKLRDNRADDAMCYYNNNSNSEYGGLYTYAAALKACPAGWHLPTDAEWTKLENYLANNGYNYDGITGGGGDKIAKAMATAKGWNASSTNGAVGNSDYTSKRNASEFSALPGGLRNYNNGEFSSAGGTGFWWSSTEYSSSLAYYRYLYYYYADVRRNGNYKSSGFSVRCVRDD